MNEKARPKRASQPILPRAIKYKDAPRYLAMSTGRFDQEVRPHVHEIPIGSRAIAFDRLELDAWVDAYCKSYGRPGRQPQKEETTWGEKERQDSACETESGTSTSQSRGLAAFTQAAGQATSKTRKPRS